MNTDATSSRWPAPGVRSLVWDGDDLVDWVAGGNRHRLDGSVDKALIRWGYRFDTAAALAGSDLAVVYCRLGTKGLVLRDGKILREINRSDYHAEVYDFPIALARLASGRDVLVHCPDDYNRLDIEDLVTGERLTGGIQRQPSDFFHSRLAVSPDARHLLSAGWVWHPMDAMQVYDLPAALADPGHLDGPGIEIDGWSDHSSATFLPDGRVAMWLMPYDDEEDPSPTTGGVLRIVDPDQPATARTITAVGRLGTILAVDNDHVLALHDHPRLIELNTGTPVRIWPDVRSGQQMSSLLMNGELPPPAALDAANRRCAFADDTGITVIRW